MIKLAYYSPLSPVQSGISEYSEDLLPALHHHATLDLFVDGYQPSYAAIATEFAGHIYDAHRSKLPRLSLRRQIVPPAASAPTAYDAVLLHMGNSPAHSYIYRALTGQHVGYPPRAGRKIVVLHDFVLHHFFMAYYLNGGQAEAYRATMAATYGEAGETVAAQVLAGRLPTELFDMPLNAAVIQAADAVLVHSRYAADLIRAAHPDKPVEVVPMGVPLPDTTDRQGARARLDLPPDAFIVTSLGHLNPYKRLYESLRAFALFAQDSPNSLYVLVGSPSPHYDVARTIRTLGLEERVRVVGFTESAAFTDYLAATDVCINLRYPTAGETSASLLRIMGAGRPVMVSRTGTFSELPDDVCIKVDVDEWETAEILAYLRRLAADPILRAALGDNARAYIASHHTVAQSASAYMRAIENWLHHGGGA